MKHLKLTKSTFSVMALIGFSALSTSALADQVILDDLIVDGSACIGLDCVNGEAFGFDTLRLKENNLRIRAVDTSTSASFPTNDWQITFNDTSNGGANKFSIVDVDAGRTPFTIEATAPSNSLYVDDGGRLGLGLSTPVVDIHVRSGNTPTLRLEQDGSSGFTPQTWDVAGNEANFFIRDATNGSTLPFRIKPGAGSNSLTIQADDDIGMGTDSPEVNTSLHVRRSDGTAKILVEEVNSTVAQRQLLELRNNGLAFLHYTDTDQNKTWRTGITTNNSYLVKQIGQPGTTNFQFSNDGTNAFFGVGLNPTFPIHASSGAHLTVGGVWTNASSRNLKEDIHEITDTEAMAAIGKLQPVTYIYKNDKKERYAGFIAEDVPEIVAQNDRKSLSPMDIVAVLTKVVKGQNKLIDDMRTRLDKLETE